YGARTALIVGFVSSFVGASLGLILGVASAYFGGRTDLIFQRVLDVFMAFPIIILALAVIAIFGTGTQNVIIAITIPFIPRCARVVRSTALAIREMPYVDAARACGFCHTRIILRHMVPNVMAPFLIMITAFVGQAILLEASLSYLGLGVQEPTPAWGLMLQGGAEEYAESAPWIAIFPGIAISLAVFGFSLFGDAVRDELDPKLRSRWHRQVLLENGFIVVAIPASMPRCLAAAVGVLASGYEPLVIPDLVRHRQARKGFHGRWPVRLNAQHVEHHHELTHVLTRMPRS